MASQFVDEEARSGPPWYARRVAGHHFSTPDVLSCPYHASQR
jgi:hypothetical protein